MLNLWINITKHGRWRDAYWLATAEETTQRLRLRQLPPSSSHGGFVRAELLTKKCSVMGH
jgi:hypothetical protein